LSNLATSGFGLWVSDALDFSTGLADFAAPGFCFGSCLGSGITLDFPTGLSDFAASSIGVTGD
jgi:hypothetical protein